MGLDLVFGAIVLILAIRGWFQGFLSQAVRIGALIAAVYVAGPLRDFAVPVAASHLTSIDRGALAQALWWLSAIVAFLVISGVALGMLGRYRNRRHSERLAQGLPSHRGDHSAGALFGALKGAILVAFLASGMLPYTSAWLDAGGWVGDQVAESKLLAWSDRYRPAERIWKSEPVQGFVDHVWTMGVKGGSQPAGKDPERQDRRGSITSNPERPDDENPRARRSSAPLSVKPSPRRSEPLDDEEAIERALDEIRRDLERLQRPAGSN